VTSVPKTQVVFYQEENGTAPILEWLKVMIKKDRKGYANCVAKIQQLASIGYELQRPAADYLRDGIYKLRAKHIHIQYRILYFFDGQNIAILAHAITKDTDRVPPVDIERAIGRKHQFEENPNVHTYQQDLDNE
jgi:hypothetical protein